MADSTAELIDRLLASGKLSPETREELLEFKQALAKDGLDATDRRYVDSLGQRLLGARRAANDDQDSLQEEADDDLVALADQGLWDVGEDEELRGWRERAEQAEIRVAELEAEVAALKIRLGES